MAWTLQITHFDIGQGDSTLITAQMFNEEGNDNVAAMTRTILVDGGLGNAADYLDSYLSIINNTYNIGLDIIVNTHYDRDHLNGITGLLNKNNTLYDNVILYDQGDPRAFQIENRYNTNVPTTARPSYPQPQSPANYTSYVNAITQRGNVNRVTTTVISIPFDDQDEATNIRKGDWLLGKELLWRDRNGNLTTPAAILGEDADANLNLNPPKVTVIAVNGYLKGDTNLPREPRTTTNNADRLKNQRSIALLVEFGTFKYYVGGDIETDQENFLQTHLNQDDDYENGISVFKCSHHGSNHSTSNGFLQRLMPEAAIISCGFRATFGGYPLPTDAVMGRLENYNNLERYFLTNDQTAAKFDRRVGQYHDNNAALNTGGNITQAYSSKAVVAGWSHGAPYFYDLDINGNLPNPRPGDCAPHFAPGNITVTVTNYGSQIERAIGPLDDPDDQDGDRYVARFTIVCPVADSAEYGSRSEDFYNGATVIDVSDPDADDDSDDESISSSSDSEEENGGDGDEMDVGDDGDGDDPAGGDDANAEDNAVDGNDDAAMGGNN
ncbi:MAG: hypothetical protein AAGN35_03480 [Bacteroidota bacterium]